MKLWLKEILTIRVILLLVIGGLLIGGASYALRNVGTRKFDRFLKDFKAEYVVVEGENGISEIVAKIVEGARLEAKNKTLYHNSYIRIPYPMGDVPSRIGVCTDVIIRAFRHAGIDLQELIHKDMASNFNKYPQLWGLKGPDTNIDHRRTPNQMTFFRRKGLSLTLDVNSDTLKDWRPGDIVYWRLPNGLLHCGILTDKRNSQGIPYVVHNLGVSTEEDCLTTWEIIGHFRYPVSP